MSRRIYIEINNTCNLSCNFCPYPLIKGKKENMSIENIKKILADIKNNIDYRIVYFHNLNEPLLHPDIDLVFEFCDNNNIVYGLTTNGLLLDKHLEAIKNSNMSELNISYQVGDELANRKRGNKLSVAEYRKYLVENLKKIATSFKGEIKIKLLITNDKSIFNNQLINGFSSHKEIVAEVNAFYVMFTGKELSSEQVDKLYELDITEFCKINLYSNVYIELFPFLTWGNFYEPVIPAKYGSCDGINGQLQIKVDGSVSPCCYDFNSCLSLGNAIEKKISEIMQSEKYLQMKKEIEQKTVNNERCRICLGALTKEKLIENEKIFLENYELEKRFVFSNKTLYL
ncbi:MAG: radical SAM protein [Acholeplasmatales bacterium]|nr:radical SAM protein [Acholeplasmatales bacterium]